MSTQRQSKGVNGVATKPTTPRVLVKKSYTPATGPVIRSPSISKKSPYAARPIVNKAASVEGERPTQKVSSAYYTMASRLANRFADMAENVTFVEKPRAQDHLERIPEEKKRPRKLEMRLRAVDKDSVAFSATFLDNTLQKMLLLQNRMLQSSAELAKAESVSDKLQREHAAQAAEMSRLIAMICAEKARQVV